MAFPRYKAKRFAGKGWAVVDRTTAAKVLPEDVDHFWASKRPAEIAADELNRGERAVAPPARYSQRRRAAR